MLTFVAHRPTDAFGQVPVADGRARVGVGPFVAGVGGLVVAAVSTTTAVRIRRLQRSAATHAHDLEHTATVGQGTGLPVRLLVLGDSAARGYGLRAVGDAFPHQLAHGLARATGRRVDVASLATDGHRTADLVSEQVPQVRALRPDVVVVSVGVNDAIRVTRRRALREDTRALLAGVRAAAGDAEVVFVTCPDLTAAPGFPRPLNLAVGLRCRRVGRVQQAVAHECDVPTVVLPRPDGSMFGIDGFHPGASGQAAMAAVTLDALVHRVDLVPASPVHP